MDEFEEMRRQLASMKLQLDKQQIVNQDLMRKVMRGKASWMNKFVNIEIFAMPFVCLFIVAFCHANGISQWFSFSFLVLTAIDTYFDTRTVSIPARLFNSPILELRRFLVRQKKERFIQTCISGTLGVVWFIMILWAMTTTHSSLLTGGVIGGAVGGVIAIIAIYRKMQRTNDRILSDIDRLENEE